jgi:hypothetical protein
MTDISGWRKRQIEQSEMCSNYGGFCKKEWVGLTDEEREEIALEVPMDAICITEAKLKEKNA